MGGDGRDEEASTEWCPVPVDGGMRIGPTSVTTYLCGEAQAANASKAKVRAKEKAGCR